MVLITPRTNLIYFGNEQKWRYQYPKLINFAFRSEENSFFAVLNIAKPIEKYLWKKNRYFRKTLVSLYFSSFLKLMKFPFPTVFFLAGQKFKVFALMAGITIVSSVENTIRLIRVYKVCKICCCTRDTYPLRYDMVNTRSFD